MGIDESLTPKLMDLSSFRSVERMKFSRNLKEIDWGDRLITGDPDPEMRQTIGPKYRLLGPSRSMGRTFGWIPNFWLNNRRLEGMWKNEGEIDLLALKGKGLGESSSGKRSEESFF
jgi:hypothetical protein